MYIIINHLSPSGHSGPAPRGGANKEKKERQLPKSIEEMPTYTESESRDFSDRNKYAGLLGSDGDDEPQD